MPGPMSAPNGNVLLTLSGKARRDTEKNRKLHTGKTEKKRNKSETKEIGRRIERMQKDEQETPRRIRHN